LLKIDGMSAAARDLGDTADLGAALSRSGLPIRRETIR